MTKGGDTSLVVLVLIATALVLMAPVLGRAGFPFVAQVVVCAAAASGLGAFLLAAAHSFLGLRKPGRPGSPPC